MSVKHSPRFDASAHRAAGYFLVVGTTLIFQFSSKNLNSGPGFLLWFHEHIALSMVNKWPMLVHIFCNVCSSFYKVKLVLPRWSCIIFDRAHNSYAVFQTWKAQCSISSTAHCTNCTDPVSHSVASPYPLPASLLCWRYSQYTCKLGYAGCLYAYWACLGVVSPGKPFSCLH